MTQMADGKQTVYNMCCAFFGIMTLSGHIEKCDEYNLSLIKKAIDAYKTDRDFILESLPVFIGEQQKLYTEGYSVLALRNEKKIRIGIFRNGGEESIDFEIPDEFSNGNLKEIYPCEDSVSVVKLKNNIMQFKSSDKLTARVVEIEL